MALLDSGVANCLPMNREKMGTSQVLMEIPVSGGRSNFW